ncbi:EFR1 family ferrodoxin [Clostridium sp. BL-8]|uniref:EFR1 family ferrodoxin n=1 Tax=Clostridium sp. BL-8 TaxID=349938 RepID=UPI00098C15DD|nr:EFR1 family ferrodoxin [Clostridium sp. BL-8]OOM80575.1 ferredoxin [Clostridium sp. BL-8]
MGNSIYFFTGTGNSLKVTEEIAKKLQECEIIAINREVETEIKGDFERIGFVFPVYYWGLPVMVADFLRKANFKEQGSTYYFAIATYGGMPGNAIPMTGSLLKDNGIHLNYNAGIKMFGNAITHYNMSKNVEKITEKSNEKIVSIAKDIENKIIKKTGSCNRLINHVYINRITKINTIDIGFNVNSSCTSCGICKNVCPAKNITLEDNKPVFHHQCESCLACIQHCPKQAINYKDKTQKRRRYTHPQIGAEKLMQYYT